MAETIPVRVLRPIYMAGERVAAGTVLQLVPLAAADAVDSGRCVLASKADETVVRAAVLDNIKATVRSTQPDGWPWQPR
jgi:hypothetical protein